MKKTSLLTPVQRLTLRPCLRRQTDKDDDDDDFDKLMTAIKDVRWAKSLRADCDGKSHAFLYSAIERGCYRRSQARDKGTALTDEERRAAAAALAMRMVRAQS